MSSEFETQFADSRDWLLLGQGEDVSYTVAGGSTTTINGILTTLDGHQTINDDGVTMDYHATLQVSLVDVPNPSNKDSVVAGGVDYKVVDVKRNTGMSTLLLFKQRVQEISRGLRGTY